MALIERMIIVDLDGTLYDSTQRSHHIEAKDWDAFHAASIDDPPNQDVIDLLIALDEYPGEVVFAAATGRNERYREITLQWLVNHKVPIDSLWMRGDDDYRPDLELKEDLINEALAFHNMEKDQIWFAIDDRDKVVDHFRSIGIPTYQVRMGTY